MVETAPASGSRQRLVGSPTEQRSGFFDQQVPERDTSEDACDGFCCCAVAIGVGHSVELCPE